MKLIYIYFLNLNSITWSYLYLKPKGINLIKSKFSSFNGKEIPITDLLQGNYGLNVNGKKRMGPTEEQRSRILKFKNPTRVPNAAYSHIKLAHSLWQEVVEMGDIVIDATCGNGFDSVKLAELALSPSSGTLVCLDIQNQALINTRESILKFNPLLIDRIHIINRNHRTFPEFINYNTVKLIVYNLGYLPGGDKNITTHLKDSIESIKNSLNLLKPLGMLSVTCYRFHGEAAVVESKEIETFLSYLDPTIWRCFSHTPINWPLAPLLITAYKLK